MMDYLKSENENATDEELMKDIYFGDIQDSRKIQSQLVERLNDRVSQKCGRGISLRNDGGNGIGDNTRSRK